MSALPEHCTKCHEIFASNAMHVAHLKLIDLHCTLGPATFWCTVAPGMWTSQWRHWAEDSLTKSGQNVGDCGL